MLASRAKGTPAPPRSGETTSNLRREGLGDIGIDAGLERGDDVFLGVAAGKHQHRQAVELGFAADLLDQVDAVDDRHIPVGEQQVDRLFAQDVLGFATVFGLDYVGDAHAFEHGGDQTAHTFGVFY